MGVTFSRGSLLSTQLYSRISVLWVLRWEYGSEYNSGWKEGVGVIGLHMIDNQGVKMEENSNDVVDW
eukprot:14867173-Ditylum_brightwellii.AAC.1